MKNKKIIVTSLFMSGFIISTSIILPLILKTNIIFSKNEELELSRNLEDNNETKN